MSTPKVSVIIPVYNVEPYIERCARSLFEQTLEEIEYIFVNDCTPDASMRILQNVLEDYAQRKNQIIIINQPYNMGAAKAREDGIKAAQGEYIIHCDSDDWVDKDMYRTMYEKAITEKLDYVLCHSIYYSDGQAHRKVTDPISEDKMKFIADMLYCSTTVSLWNRLVKREIYNTPEFLFPTNHMMEDKAYAVQIAYYSGRYGYVDGSYYYYYQNPNSVCGNTSETALVNNFKQATANIQIVEEFLHSKGIYHHLKSGLEHSQFVVMGFLVPMLKNNNRYRKLWMNTFPQVIRSLWFSKHISLPLKMISFMIVLGIYPIVNSLLPHNKK